MLNSNFKYKCIINEGEEDEMEAEGFKKNPIKVIFCWSATLMSVGIIQLLFYWWPLLYLRCSHSRSPLISAHKLLITEKYNKHKNRMVKDVKKINLYEGENSDNYNNKHIDVLKLLFKNEINNYKPVTNTSKNIFSVADSLNTRAEDCKVVRIKKLTYVWIKENGTFLKLTGLGSGMTYNDFHNQKTYIKSVEESIKSLFGHNEIHVAVDSYVKLFFLEVLNPFYFFQMFSISLWFAENYIYYTVGVIIMTVFGITLSIKETHSNQVQLRKTIHSYGNVLLKRGDQYEEVASYDLIPGHIVKPKDGTTLLYDAVIVSGCCIVNESMLTGESVPMVKSGVPRSEEVFCEKRSSSHILYSGTKVIQNKEEVVAVVIRTGFSTAKGSLVRSILYPPPADYKFDRDSYRFIYGIAVLAILAAIYTFIHQLQDKTRTLGDNVIKSLDLITIAIPAALPGSMTIGRMYAAKRLKKQLIYCINSRVINVAGSLNCICFDKTGTLTEEGLDVWGVVPTSDGKFTQPQNSSKEFKECQLKFAMATTHSLAMIEGTLSGDPLDVKMFEFTEWTFHSDNNNEASSLPMVYPSYEKYELKHTILHAYQFSSDLQRMSVIVQPGNSNDLEFYSKGSPEVISSISNPATVPKDLADVLERYTKQGFRVLALAHKTLKGTPLEKAKKLTRDQLENDLIFLGLLVLENKVKPVSKPVIKQLSDSNFKIVMITGDNIHTAVCVARECEIIGANETVLELDSNESGLLCSIQRGHILSPGIKTNVPFKELEEGYFSVGYQLVMTSKAWEEIKKNHSSLIPKIVVRTSVFARMSSLQKKQIIVELQQLGYCVGMCGDGANDCGALKSANVGISLSSAEASVASPFTSRVEDISCVPAVVAQGRSSLATSFGIFKFLIVYCCIQFITAFILYTIKCTLADFQYLYIDLFTVVFLAFTFGKTEAHYGALSPLRPPNSMLSFSPLFSMVGHVLVFFLFQIVVFNLVTRFPWFTPFVYKYNNSYISYQNYAIFTLSNFQYLIAVVCFSQGSPYRRPLYTNFLLFATILIICCSDVFIMFHTFTWVKNILELKIPPGWQFQAEVIGLAIINLFVCLFYEKFIIEYLVFIKLKFWKHKHMKPSKKYVSVINATENYSWVLSVVGNKKYS